MFPDGVKCFMDTKKEDHFYAVYPKVIGVGETTKVTIAPLFDHVALQEDHEYRFELSGLETYWRKEIIPEIVNGKMVFELMPDMEQEFVIIMADKRPNGSVVHTRFAVYAVEADLRELRPWRGDFHLHSSRSDGKESPLFVASAYREAGFDFFALTDHHRREPSMEVVSAMSELETDFRVYPGEEVHPPENPVHHVNFGGSFSVNDLHRDKETYERELAEMEASLDVPQLDDASRKIYASSCWVFQKIREAGGVSIFCHPHWLWREKDHYNVSEQLQRVFFDELRFDALELVSGYYRHQSEENSLQVSRWIEEQAKGRHIPVVGISDSHGVTTGQLFNWYYTIVLAKDAEFASIADAIRSGRALAVNAMPDTPVQVYGEYRFVKYVYFLLREVLPLHDEECREEGRQMRHYFAGEREAAAYIASCKGRVKSLYDRLFA